MMIIIKWIVIIGWSIVFGVLLTDALTTKNKRDE
jgi:hypothetical protein